MGAADRQSHEVTSNAWGFERFGGLDRGAPAFGVRRPGRPGNRAQPLAEPVEIALALPLPERISTLRGLACSATGMVTVSTPSS